MTQPTFEDIADAICGPVADIARERGEDYDAADAAFDEPDFVEIDDEAERKLDERDRARDINAVLRGGAL